MKMINVGNVAMPLEDYAIVGNAILGIKGTGKTYLAKSIAEQLLDFNVQPVIFDPIGVWRHLRRPAPGKNGRGFRIVVAGGQEPDLPLTVQSASEVVRAAIRENVPLVIDLYDRNLSKGDWKKIVRACCRVLFYENTAVTRHIIIEEAAEFVPQRIDDGETYAELEKIVRMGGNVALGITLVNQRSQEVNKAVLELCENLILMRQRGAKAIEVLSKWVGMLSPDKAEQIKAMLPNMETGEAWLFAGAGSDPKLVKCGPIHSFHPDRKRPELLAKAGAPADLGDFVSRMSGELATLIEQAKANDPAELRAQIRALQKQLAGKPGAAAVAAPVDSARLTALRTENRALRQIVAKHKAVAIEAVKLIDATEHAQTKVAEIFDNARAQLRGKLEPLTKLVEEVTVTPDAVAFAAPAPQSRKAPTPSNAAGVGRSAAMVASGADGAAGSLIDLGKPGNGAYRMLDAIMWWDSVGVAEPTNDQVAGVMSIGTRGGGFTEPRAKLRAAGMIEYTTIGSKLTEAGRAASAYPERTPTRSELHRRVLDCLPARARAMLLALINAYPDGVPNDELAAAAGIPGTRGGNFTEPRALLSKRGLLCKGNVAPAFLFPEDLD